MFRKIISYITLICFINAYCIECALACWVMDQLRKETTQGVSYQSLNIDYQSESRDYILDLKSILDQPLQQMDLKHGDLLVGQLYNYHGHVSFQGNKNNNFRITKMPELNSLRVEMDGSLTLTPFQSCFINALALKGVREFKIEKGARFHSDLLITEDILPSLKNFGNMDLKLGILNVGTLINNGFWNILNHQIDVNKLMNRGTFKADSIEMKAQDVQNTGAMTLGNTTWKVDKTSNTGMFQSRQIISNHKGNWLNTKTGKIIIEELFQGTFTRYEDYGETTVQGLATINTESGSLNGVFQARNAIFRTQDNLFVPQTATFSIQDHITLHSDRNLDFMGSLVLKFQKDWPPINLSPQILDHVTRLMPGAFLSTKKNLTKGGSVSSHNTSIFFSSGGNYDDASGMSRSGFFENNSTHITAVEASLAGSLHSSHDVHLKAQVADLLGHQKIEGTLWLKVEKKLTQHENAHLSVGSLSGRIGDASIAGSIDLAQQMAIKVLNLFYTAHGSKIKGGSIAVEADQADLNGSVNEGKILQITTKQDITLGETFDASINTCVLGSDQKISIEGKIVSKQTHLKAKDVTIEKMGKIRSREETIARVEGFFKNRGTLNANKHFFKAGTLFSNSGNISSEDVFSVDTGFYVNLIGGNISAKQAMIHADWACLNLLSNLSAKDVEINTMLNLNALGRVSGSDSLTINALLLNADIGGVYQSNGYTSNSLLNLSHYGLCTFAIPSGFPRLYDEDKALYNQPLLRSGLGIASNLFGGSPKSVAMAMQMVLGAKDLGASVHQFLTMNNKGDEGNEYRPSRLVKKLAMGCSFGLSAFQMYQGASKLYSDTAQKSDSANPPKLIPLWDRSKDVAVNLFGGNSTINSIYSWDKGFNLTSHVTRRNLWDYDDSWTSALTTSTTTRTGADNGTKYAYRSTAMASGDYAVGGYKNIAADYTVQADGIVIVDSSANIHAKTASIISQDAMTIKSGAQASGESVLLQGKGDVSFAGSVTATETAVVRSTDASLVIHEGTNINGKETQITAGQQLTVEKGAQTSGEKVQFQGKEDVSFAGSVNATEIASVASTDASLVIQKGTNINGKEIQNAAGQRLTVEPGAQASGESVLFQGRNDVSFAGTVNATETAVVRSTDGSLVVQEGANVNGKETQITAGQRLDVREGAQTSGEKVLLQGKGDVSFAGIVNATETAVVRSTDGSVDIQAGARVNGKEIQITGGQRLDVREGAQTSGEKVQFQGKEDVSFAGTVNATEIASVASTDDSLVIQKGTNINGKEIQNTAGQRLTVEPGAQASGEIVLFRGKEDVSFAGTVNATEVAIVDSTNGSLVIQEETNINGKEPQTKSATVFLGSDQTKSIVIEDGATCEGKSLAMKGPGVTDIPDLMTQEGKYRNFNFSDTVQVNTNSLVVFPSSITSASTNFLLDTNNAITVNPMNHLYAPGILSLHANNGEFTLGQGSSVKSGVFTHVKGSGDVIGQYYQQNTMWGTQHTKHHVKSVDFRSAQFLGGSGLEYTYEDPETGLKETRYIGLLVEAVGKVTGTAMTFNAQGDVRFGGELGTENFGVSQPILEKYSKHRNKARTKRHYTFNTLFYEGEVISSAGKVTILAPNGIFHQDAGSISSQSGIDIFTLGDINTPELKGTKGSVTHRSHRGLFQKICEPYSPADKKKWKGITQTTHMTLFSGPVRYISQEENVIMPGLVLVAPNSPVFIKGKKVILDCPIHHHTKETEGFKWSSNFSLFDKFKNTSTCLDATKNLMDDFSKGDYKKGLQEAANPSIGVSLDYVVERTGHDSLGAGSMVVGSLTVDATILRQGNGYAIDVLGDADINALIYGQSAAKLAFYNRRTAVGIGVGVNASGPTVDVHGSYSGTKGHNYTPSTLTVHGNLSGNINHLTQKGGMITAGSASAQIGDMDSKTLQNVSNTKVVGAAVDVLTGNFSVYGTPDGIRTRTNPDQKSGFFIEEAKPGFSIGSADLTGAKIAIDHDSGATIGPIKRHSLPDEKKGRGITLGFSGNMNNFVPNTENPPSNFGTVTVGVSNNGHSVSVSTPIKNSAASENNSTLFKSVGDVTYQNAEKGIRVSAPIMTGVNSEAWKDFGSSCVSVGGKIKEGAQSLWPEPAPREPVVSVMTPVEPVVLDSLANEDALSLESSSKEVPLSNPLSLEDNSITPDTFEKNEPFLDLEAPILPEQSPLEFPEDADNSSLPPRKAFSKLRPLLLEPLYGMHNSGPVGSSIKTQYPIAIRPHTKPVPGASALEPLFDPFVFEGVAFNHRLAGTNIYLENPSLLGVAQNAYNDFSNTPSTYGQKSFRAFNDPELCVFFYNKNATPSGNYGEIFMNPTLKNRGVHGMHGSQYLSGDFVQLGALANEPHTPLSFGLGHEGAHHYQKLNSGGSFIPGYVPNNPSLTHINRARLFEAYSADARGLGFKSFSTMPRPIYETTPIEGIKMFHAPFKYFETTFKNSLLKEGIFLPQGHIETILNAAHESMVKGVLPSATVPDIGSVGPCLIKAEQTMLSEIPTFFTEVDMHRPGFVKHWSPRTHTLLESFDKNVPLWKQPLSIGASAIPTPTDFIQNRWWQNPSWKQVKKFGSYGLAVADLPLHIFCESRQGYDFPDAFGRGVVGTLIDAPVFGAGYGAIAIISPPLAAAVGGITAVDGFLPTYNAQDFNEEYLKIDKSISAHDPMGYMGAVGQLEVMQGIGGIKLMLKPFSYVGNLIATGSNFVFKKFDEKCPNVIPFISGMVRYNQEKFVNDSLIEAKKTHNFLNSMGIEPRYDVSNLKIQTPRQVIQTIDLHNDLYKLKRSMGQLTEFVHELGVGGD